MITAPRHELDMAYACAEWSMHPEDQALRARVLETQADAEKAVSAEPEDASALSLALVTSQLDELRLLRASIEKESHAPR